MQSNKLALQDYKELIVKQVMMEQEYGTLMQEIARLQNRVAKLVTRSHKLNDELQKQYSAIREFEAKQ